MTAGLPGVGIGGMFYVLSAIAMPFHAAYRVVKRRHDPGLADEPPVRWRLVFRQLAIALGIVAVLWATGWALGALLAEHPSALGGMESTVSGRTAPNAIKVSALILSFGTMCIVLIAVQVARLILNSRQHKTAAVSGVVGALMLLSASSANGQNARGSSPLGARIDAAERTYQAGDSAAAVAAYGTVLALDPNNSRALFRLGQLWRHDPKRSLPMFRRYTSVVPNDAWGHMALGDALAADGNFSEALREYDEARRIAPKERDVALGHARVMGRAGRSGDAVALLQRWSALHPGDSEATREIDVQRRMLGSARAKHAPAVELTAFSGGDSDGNRSYSAVGLISAQLTDYARLTATAGRKRSAGFLDALYYDGTVGLTIRPVSSFRLEAVAGAVRTTRNESFEYPDTAQVVPRTGRGKGRREQPAPPAIVRTDSAIAENLAIGSLRAVWKKPGTAGLVDLRASRVLLDATPVLVINRVMRRELAARVDVPLTRRFRVRGGARAGSYDAIGESNTRTSLLGGVATSVTDAAEVAAIFQQISFDHATTSGYFAPRVAQLAELATYTEIESDSGRLLILDAGAGGQRYAEFGSAVGQWKPVFRIMAELRLPIRPGTELRGALDSYNSQIASEAAAGTSWRYASASLSVRIALR